MLTPQKVDYTLPDASRSAYSCRTRTRASPLSSPAIIQPIVGSTQTVTVSPIQQHLSFLRWSDGVHRAEQTFTVGTTPQTFTAIYENQSPTAVITPRPPPGRHRTP